MHFIRRPQDVQFLEHCIQALAISKEHTTSSSFCDKEGTLGRFCMDHQNKKKLPFKTDYSSFFFSWKARATQKKKMFFFIIKETWDGLGMFVEQVQKVHQPPRKDGDSHEPRHHDSHV